MGLLIAFGVILIIVLAVKGNKTETITRVDEEGNRTTETIEHDSPGAGTVAARVILSIIGVGILLFFVMCLGVDL